MLETNLFKHTSVTSVFSNLKKKSKRFPFKSVFIFYSFIVYSFNLSDVIV